MNAPIEADELFLALKKAKTNKASGIDMIPVEFYKHGGLRVQNATLCLFNFLIKNGEYPEMWSQGLINPILKSCE